MHFLKSQIFADDFGPDFRLRVAVDGKAEVDSEVEFHNADSFLMGKILIEHTIGGNWFSCKSWKGF